MHYQELSLLLSGMVSYIQSLEQLMEVVLLVNVVIRLQHVEEETLAETARANQKKEVTGPFHFLEEHGFINQVFIFLPYLLKVRDTVRNKLVICVHSDCLLFLLAKIIKNSLDKSMFVTIFDLENEKEDFVVSQSHLWLVSGTKRYTISRQFFPLLAFYFILSH